MNHKLNLKQNAILAFGAGATVPMVAFGYADADGMVSTIWSAQSEAEMSGNWPCVDYDQVMVDAYAEDWDNGVDNPEAETRGCGFVSVSIQADPAWMGYGICAMAAALSQPAYSSSWTSEDEYVEGYCTGSS